MILPASTDTQQTGPEYYKVSRYSIFGVCNDGSGQQVTYVIDEAENPDKGADCVISLLHHFFETHSKGESHVYLHADNCTAQNRNNVLEANVDLKGEEKAGTLPEIRKMHSCWVKRVSCPSKG